MKYLIDADLLLESLLNRFPLSGSAETLWTMLELQEIEGYLTTTGLEKILSICKKLAGVEAADEIAWNIENIVSMCPVDLEILRDARVSKLKDFESAVELACAEAYGFDAIVTETPEHFEEVETQIFLVKELVESWKKNGFNDHSTSEEKYSPILVNKGKNFLAEQGGGDECSIECDQISIYPYPDIGSFEPFIQESLTLHQLNGDHTVECIIEQAYKRCETNRTGEPITEIRLAWLKTSCLEVISELSQAENRQKFDHAVQALFDDNDPDSLSFCASITRTLRQFRLSGTYEAKDVIAEAYTRGVKHINAGTRIDIPLAWLRGSCLHVISELKRKQLKSDKPKFDRADCITEDVVLCGTILQEDLWALQLALKKLSKEERQLLCVRIFKGLSWQEIGESISRPNALPLSPGTARQRGSRALQKLRQHYDSIREDVQLPDTVDS
jgi:RNA polymerase sigma factor (sigma-70 family)